MDSEHIYASVASHYSALSSNFTESSHGYGKAVAQSFGYTEEELSSIPAQSNLGLSCGNPLAIASLREGETVIDLGSGAGFDVFLAAKKVGPAGRAIGIDANKEMLALAEQNKARSGASNVEFAEGRITNVPLGNGIADVIISNCVVNLVPEAEKQLVFDEMFRLLKPGGRVAVSDILAKKPLPLKLQNNLAAYVGCISGASLASQYQAYLRLSGFPDPLIHDTNADLNIYLDTLPDGTRQVKGVEGRTGRGSVCCVPALPESMACSNQEDIVEVVSASKSGGGGCSTAPAEAGAVVGLDLGAMADELTQIDLNEWVGSYKIFAVKP